MLDDLLTEHRLTLPALARREGVNPSTAWRWALRGVRGARLQTFAVGGRRYTTAEAFARFVAATTAVAAPPCLTTQACTTPRREAQIAAAERELRAAGA
ncbi:MAG: DUF1580 domain-containing protein [Planctomycetales bacterium]|nr:DUF1580 domain-containing protein [Planctomycetales bacterium]